MQNALISLPKKHMILASIFPQKNDDIPVFWCIMVCISLNIWSALSRWCISHRKKAKPIVETWEKFFNSSQREQRISFLYLANDILQNSRRKGSEFVNEFWKVLPAALKQVYENGDDHGKKVATRLVSPILFCEQFSLSSCSYKLD